MPRKAAFGVRLTLRPRPHEKRLSGTRKVARALLQGREFGEAGRKGCSWKAREVSAAGRMRVLLFVNHLPPFRGGRLGV